MAKNTAWSDEFWLPLLQLYLQKPTGMKPTYSRGMVSLGIELHIHPSILSDQMKKIDALSTPKLERIYHTYANNPQRLKRAVGLWREMRGFGSGNTFYDGIDVSESFEGDFRPLAEDERLTPIALTLILDLYFRLTPITMVSETPEVIEMARLLKVNPQLVTEILELYQLCDPYLNRSDVSMSPLLTPCQQVWTRYSTTDINRLAALAEELKAFYRS